MINQLTLGVSLKDEATFANYYAGQNRQLTAALQKTARLQGERVIYFFGATGEGRTHLLQACSHEANQHGIPSVYIPLENRSDLSPAMFDGLENVSLVCIDDVHQLTGHPAWEEAFFYAYNRIHDAGGSLIVSSTLAPKSLGLIPDVVSRLAWGFVFQLQSLSDEEKLQVLKMRAERRGLALTDEVSKFILTHCPRHMSTLFAALDVLDRASLAAQRKLTIPFVKTILQI